MGKYFLRYWILPVSLALGAYAFLPLAAPVLMHFGQDGFGRLIYSVYSAFCHQLPERSFFLFGDRLTYTLAEVQANWQATNNPLILRQFIGNQAMGWKVAWSDRMVSMFTSLWLLGLLWWPLRRKLRPLPWWGLVLFILPLAVDGTSHLFSDLAGIGNGFRDTNLWLAQLTRHAFPPAFYAGDAWGSFNSLMRILTGFLFAVGIVWYTYPYLDKAINRLDRPLPARITTGPEIIRTEQTYGSKDWTDQSSPGR